MENGYVAVDFTTSKNVYKDLLKAKDSGKPIVVKASSDALPVYINTLTVNDDVVISINS